MSSCGPSSMLHHFKLSLSITSIIISLSLTVDKKVVCFYISIAFVVKLASL